MNKDLIKKVIYEQIPQEKIDSVYVFGSQARGDARNDSDTDIYVVLDDDKSYGERIKLQSRIRRSFVFDYHMTVDILVKPKERYLLYQDVAGSIEYSVKREGIAL